MKESSFTILENLLSRYPRLICIKDDFVSSIELLANSFSSGKKLLVCGNGGSAADSEHIVGELMKGFIKKRPISKELKARIGDDSIADNLQGGLPSISLTVENALSTAFLNDVNPFLTFAQQVNVLGNECDVLLCISTSGNSLNCVNAAKVARAKNLTVISLTGKKESLLSDISDVTIKVPELETYKIQELHLPVYHALCLILENEFFEE